MLPEQIMATPAKIVLKSSTKMSLNARFTNIMKTHSVTPAGIRAQVASERLASEKNRRLAQQMERRPSVAAELGTRPAGSVRDRLGSAPTRGRSPRGRGRFQTRGRIASNGRGRGFSTGRGRGGRGFSRGVRGRTLSGRRGGLVRGASARGGRGFGGRGRGRGRGRGGRQQRGGANVRRPTPNKEKLDEQLDSYMTKTKSAMNAELDSYMAEIAQ